MDGISSPLRIPLMIPMMTPCIRLAFFFFDFFSLQADDMVAALGVLAQGESNANLIESMDLWIEKRGE